MRNQLRCGAALAYINLLVKTAAQLLYIPLLVQILGQEEYGIYTLALSVASYLTILNLGIDSSYIHFFSKTVNDKKEDGISRLNATYFMLFSLLGVVALVVGYVLIMVLPRFFSDFTVSQIEATRKMLVLLTINVALSFPLGLFNAYIVAHEKHVTARLITLITTIANPLVSVVALLSGGGAIWVVVVTVATNILSHVIRVIYAIVVLKFRLRFTRSQSSTVKAIMSFSYLIFVQIIAEQTNWNIDKILLGRYQGPGAVAVYGTASQLQSIYMAIALAISGLFSPQIHRLVAEKKHKEVNSLFLKVGKIQFSLLGLVLSGFILFGRSFIQLWVGPEYIDAYAIALLLMIPSTVDLIQNTGIEIQRAMGLQKDRAIVYAVVSVLNLLISIPLCKTLGGIGCAIGTAISFLMCNVLYMNIYYRKKMHLEIGMFWKEIVKRAIPVVLITVAGYLVLSNTQVDNFVELCIGVVVYTLVYVVVYFLTNVILFKDKEIWP